MHPHLCLLSCAQNLSVSPYKRPVLLAVGVQDRVTQAGEGRSAVYALGPSEFSNVNATYSEYSPDENTGCTDVPWRARGAARTSGAEPTVAEGTGI